MGLLFMQEQHSFPMAGFLMGPNSCEKKGAIILSRFFIYYTLHNGKDLDITLFGRKPTISEIPRNSNSEKGPIK